jgi:hypothetical protein
MESLLCKIGLFLVCIISLSLAENNQPEKFLFRQKSNSFNVLKEKNNFKDSNLKGPRTHFKHHKKPKVGHFQSINGLYDDLEVKRIQRKTRLINIPDNWDKNPFLLQTYK